MKKTIDCERRREEYTGEPKKWEFQGIYRIPRRSVYERMVYYIFETGFDIQQTTILVNVELHTDD